MAKGQSASVSQSGGRQNVANDAAGFWATSIAPGFLWSSGYLVSLSHDSRR